MAYTSVDKKKLLGPLQVFHNAPKARAPARNVKRSTVQEVEAKRRKKQRDTSRVQVTGQGVRRTPSDLQEHLVQQTLQKRRNQQAFAPTVQPAQRMAQAQQVVDRTLGVPTLGQVSYLAVNDPEAERRRMAVTRQKALQDANATQVQKAGESWRRQQAALSDEELMQTQAGRIQRATRNVGTGTGNDTPFDHFAVRMPGIATKSLAGGLMNLLPATKLAAQDTVANYQNPEWKQNAEEYYRYLLDAASDSKVALGTMEEYRDRADRAWQARDRMHAAAAQSILPEDSIGQRLLHSARETLAQETKDYTPTGKFLANTAVSVAQNLPTQALSIATGNPTLGLALMSGSAAGQRMGELSDQGVGAREAWTRGMLSGGIEWATERMPLENLMELVSGGGRGLVRDVLRQMGTEGSEEAVSYLLNYIADKAAGDPNAQFSLAELAKQALGGAISGGVMGGFASGFGAANTDVTPLQGPGSVDQAVRQWMTEGHAVRETLAPAERGKYNEGITQEGGLTGGTESGVHHDRGWLGGPQADSQGEVAPSAGNGRGNEGLRTESGSKHGGSQSVSLEDSGGRQIEPVLSERLVGTRIADEGGRPIPVDHFTNNMEFTEFQEGDTGFHFGSESQAQGRAVDKGGTGRTIRAYLNIQAPIRIPVDIMNWKAAPLAMRLYAMDILSIEENNRVMDLAQRGQEYNSPAAVELRRILREKGYDGVIYSNGFEGQGDSYIAFYPEQVVVFDDGRGRSEPSTLLGQFGAQETIPSPVFEGRKAQETGEAFQARTQQGGGQLVSNGKGIAAVYPTAPDAIQTVAKAALDRAEGFGLHCVVVDRPLEVNRNGVTTLHGEATTLRDGTIYIWNGTQEAAPLVVDHEKMHAMKFLEKELYNQFYDVLAGNINYSSAKYEEIITSITKAYANQSSGVSPDLFYSEMVGNLAGEFAYDPVGARTEFGELLYNFDEVFSTWREVNTQFEAVLKHEGDGHSVRGNGPIQSTFRSENWREDNTDYRGRTGRDSTPGAGVQTAGGGDAQAAEGTAGPGNQPVPGRGRGLTEQVEDGPRPLGADTYTPRPTVDELSQKYGNLPAGEFPAREAAIPRKSPEGPTSRFARTAAEASSLRDEMAGAIRQEVAEGTFAYVPSSNERNNQATNDLLAQLGTDGAQSYLQGKLQSGERVGAVDVALGERLIQLAAQQGDTERVVQLTADVAAMGTELGQAVQALSLLKRMGPEGTLLALQRQVQRWNSQHQHQTEKVRQRNRDQIGALERQKVGLEQQGGNQAAVDKLNREIQKLSGELVLSPERVQDILSQTDQKGLDGALERAWVELGRQMPSNWVDKWNALRMMAMLCNPTTHIRNILGNAAFYPAVQLKNLVKIPLEHLLMPKYKGDPTAAVLNRSSEVDQGYLQLAHESYQENAKWLQASGKYNPSNAIQDSRVMFDGSLFGRNNAVTQFTSQVLEQIRKANGRALETEDAWFLGKHYESAYAQYLKANDYTHQSSGRQTLLQQQAHQWAAEEAWRGTYRDASAFAEALTRFSNTNPATQFLVEGIMPFKKTPINILKRGLNYSPVGVLTGIYRMGVDVKSGKTTAANAIDQLASGLTGTGVLLLGYLLASLGLVSGEGEEDKKARAYKRQMTGWQPYSLTLEDRSYTLDWMAPMSLPFFVGVNLQEQLRTSDNARPAQAVWDALLSISNPMVEMSMLSGLDRAIQSAGYASGSGGSAVQAFALSAAQSYAGQVFPTFGGRINRMLDGTQRNTYYKDKTSDLPGDLQTAIRSTVLQKAIPGGSKLIEPKLDAWGREQKEGVGERLVENLVSPGYYSHSKVTAVDREILRLYDVLGDNGVIPATSPNKYLTVDGQRKDLSAKEYTRYTRVRGQTAYKTVEGLIKDSSYKHLTDEEKAAVVQRAYSYAAEKAKAEVVPSYNSKLLEEAGTCEKTGISVSTYLLYQETLAGMQADKDKNGVSIPGSKKEKVYQWLRKKPGLSPGQKAALFAAAGYKEEGKFRF